jgi:hypothetical protein
MHRNRVVAGLGIWQLVYRVHLLFQYNRFINNICPAHGHHGHRSRLRKYIFTWSAIGRLDMGVWIWGARGHLLLSEQITLCAKRFTFNFQIDPASVAVPAVQCYAVK